MRVIAHGRFEGQEVEVSWSKQDRLDGPALVLRAITHKCADVAGTAIGIPGHEMIRGSYLDYDFGFAYIAKLVLEDARFEYPDGRPEPMRASSPDAVQ